jgi:hypothetical protein
MRSLTKWQWGNALGGSPHELSRPVRARQIVSRFRASFRGDRPRAVPSSTTGSTFGQPLHLSSEF